MSDQTHSLEQLQAALSDLQIGQATQNDISLIAEAIYQKQIIISQKAGNNAVLVAGSVHESFINTGSITIGNEDADKIFGIIRSKYPLSRLLADELSRHSPFREFPDLEQACTSLSVTNPYKSKNGEQFRLIVKKPYTGSVQFRGTAFLGEKSAFFDIWPVAPIALTTIDPLIFASIPLDRLPNSLDLELPNPLVVKEGIDRDKFFVSRAGVLAQIQDHLINRQDDPILVIHGIAGIGKTSLALDALHRFGPYFPGGVFWIDGAGGSAAVEADIARCAKEMGIAIEGFSQKEITDKVVSQWAGAVHRLIIFNDFQKVDQLSFLLDQKTALRQSGSNILITSNYQEWDDSKTITLRQLQPEESVTLLAGMTKDLSPEKALRISEALGHYPMALYLTGKYLGRYPHYADQYLADIQKQDLQLDLLEEASEFLAKLPRKHSVSIFKTFERAYQHLDEQTSAKSRKLMQQILNRLRYCQPGVSINPNLLSQGIGYKETVDLLQTLINNGLLEGEAGASVSVHRLALQFLRTKKIKPQALAQAEADVEIKLLELASASAESESPLRFSEDHIVAHLQLAAERAFQREDERAGEICFFWNRYNQLASQYKEALIYAERAVAIGSQSNGFDSLKLTRWLNGLGLAYYNCKQYDSAEERYLQAYKRVQALERSQQTADLHGLIANNLGVFYTTNGLKNFDQAEAYYVEALEVWGQDSADNQRHIGKIHSNRGTILFHQDKFEEAIQHYELARKIFEQCYKDSIHPQLGDVYYNLGEALIEVGRREEALVWLQKGKDVFTAVYGKDSDAVSDINDLIKRA